MKKILIALVLLSLLAGCGKDKYPTLKSKLELAYKGAVLHDREAAEELNKIDKEYKKSFEKLMEKYDKNPDYEENKEEKYLGDFAYMMYICESKARDFKGVYGDNKVVPPLSEVIADNGDPVSFNFRLKREYDGEYKGKYVDIMTDEEKPFTGIAVKRNMDGNISEVMRFKDGEKVEQLEYRDYGWSNRLETIIYYKDNMPYIMKEYEDYPRTFKEVSVVLERFDDGKVKKVYKAPNSYTKGEIFTVNKYGTIKKREKLK